MPIVADRMVMRKFGKLYKCTVRYRNIVKIKKHKQILVGAKKEIL